MRVKRLNSAVIITIAMIVGCIGGHPAQAAVVGPVYPPPGGVTFNSTGSIGTIGATRTYSAFAPSELATMYFGKSSAVPVQLSMDGATFTGAETLTYQGSVGNTATWTGSSQILQTSGPSIAVDTRLVITLSGNIGSWEAPGPLGIPSAADAVADVNGDFNAFVRMEAKPTASSTWQGYLDLYNNTAFKPTSSSTAINVGTAFYSIPEPSSLTLLGIGGIAMLRRRRRRA